MSDVERLIPLLADVAADNRKRIAKKAIPRRRSATVLSFDEDTGDAEVLIDGDDEPTALQVTGNTPEVDDRVVIEFQPPHGIALAGYVLGGASSGGSGSGGTPGADGADGADGEPGEPGAPGRLTTAGRIHFGASHSYAADNLNSPFGGTNPMNGDEVRDTENLVALIRDAVVGNALDSRYLRANVPACVAGSVFDPGTTAVVTVPIPEDAIVEAVYYYPNLGMTGANTNTRIHQLATQTFAGQIVFAARQYNLGTDLTAGIPQALYLGMGGVLAPDARARTTPTSLYAFPSHQNGLVYPAGGTTPIPNSITFSSVPLASGLADPGGTLFVRLGTRLRNTAQGGGLLLMGGVYMGGYGAQFASHRAPQAFGVECNITTGASSSATSLTVEALAAPIPDGWSIPFSNGVTAVVNTPDPLVPVPTGATSIPVNAISGAIPVGHQGFAKPAADGGDSYAPEATFVSIIGVNDAPWWTLFGPLPRAAWRESVRSVIALWSCPALWPASRRNIVHTGGEDFYQPAAGQWVTNSPYGLATQPNKRLGAGDSFTLRVGPDFPGGAIDLFFMGLCGTSHGGRIDISVDGGPAITLDTSSVSPTANYDAITGTTATPSNPFLVGTGYNLSMVGRTIDHPGVPTGAVVGAVNDAGTAITIWDPVTNTALDADADTTSAAGRIIGYVPMVKRLTGLALGAHTITATVTGMDAGASAAVIFYGYGIETPTPVLWCNIAQLPNGFAAADIANLNADTAAVLAGTADPVGTSDQEPALSTLVELIDIDGLLDSDPANFLSDSLHPNAAGHRLIADLIMSRVGGMAADGSTVTVEQFAQLDARLAALEAGGAIAGIYETDIGDGSASLFGVTHNLGKYYVEVTMFDKNTDVRVDHFDYLPIDDNNGAVFFTDYTPTLNQFRLIVKG